MTIFYFILGFVAVVLVGCWLWRAIDRYHMRCAIRETDEFMRRHHGYDRRLHRPKPGAVPRGQGSMRSEP